LGSGERRVMEDLLVILGVGCLMMTPMVFGAITVIYSLDVAKMWWEKDK